MNWLLVLVLTTTVVAFQWKLCHGDELGKARTNFYWQLRMEESRDGQNVGNRLKKHRGLYQISHSYWLDGCQEGNVKWRWFDDVWNQEKCEKVMFWYWHRWAPTALAKDDYHTLARYHYGGPTLCVTEQAHSYADRVLSWDPETKKRRTTK